MRIAIIDADLNGKSSACYKYLSDFEEKFPEVAYFYDLKFERSSKDGVQETKDC